MNIRYYLAHHPPESGFGVTHVPTQDLKPDMEYVCPVTAGIQNVFINVKFLIFRQ